ncbi:TAXI family TRAP transporter solute-binding subunit [Ostreibacterium oceani]|uniref:TAXI family TRAP transporter solute-binding subunit n=1 Tax=Ostreibacterium oceani TaxID=2654998 RepID=A0A6N7ESZ8_9GAMM|nr:TAXI family TRAP transporter solute-binding subunit [Ostreibacterium oceani]MPV85671.1 TAXI family TRAP transporter solute-binding subunit [Ostreibacterium oceani]
MRRRHRLNILLWVAMCLPALAMSQGNIIKIGTGSTGGAYYPVGGAVCRYMKEARDDGKKSICFAQPTGGSVDNLQLLAAGTMDLGIVQSDTLIAAYNGTGAFADKANDQLRVMFSLHQEMFTIVATQKSGIKTFDDLAGKTINLGGLNSGSYLNMRRLLDALMLDVNHFASTRELSPDAALDALCSGEIHATVYMVGHPNDNIRNSLSRCDGQLVSLSTEQIAALQTRYPYYVQSVVPEDLYAGQTAATTFGLSAVLVTTAKADTDAIYNLTKAALENIAGLRTVHPTLSQLSAVRMASGQYEVPYHPGALQYLEEKSLLPQ